MFFLGTYAMIPVAVTVLLLLVMIPFNTIEEERSFISIRQRWIIGTTILVGSAICSYFLYQYAKVGLKKHFFNNGEIVCNYKKENIIIQKEAHYMLKDGYFIKDGIAIDIDNCKYLKDK